MPQIIKMMIFILDSTNVFKKSVFWAWNVNTEKSVFWDYFKVITT